MINEELMFVDIIKIEFLKLCCLNVLKICFYIVNKDVIMDFKLEDVKKCEKYFKFVCFF